MTLLPICNGSNFMDKDMDTLFKKTLLLVYLSSINK